MEEISKKEALKILIEADIRECKCNPQFLEELVKEHHEMKFYSSSDIQQELDEIYPKQYKVLKND